MPKTKLYQSNFSSGFLDPKMAARSDIKMYQQGLLTSDNWYPLVQGGITRRPGTRLLTYIPDDGAGRFGRIWGFEFSETEKYILWLHAITGTWKIYALDPDAGIGEWYELPTNGTLANQWYALTQDQWEQVRYAQLGDTALFFFPTGAKPTRLVRTGLNTFEWQDFDFETNKDGISYSPYYKFAKSQVNMRVFNDPTGEYKVGTSCRIFIDSGPSVDPTGTFVQQHVGSRIRYRGKQMTITSVINPFECQVTLNEKIERSVKLEAIEGLTTGFKVGELVFGQESGAMMEVRVVSDESSQYTIPGDYTYASDVAVGSMDTTVTTDGFIIGFMVSGKFAANERVEGVDSGAGFKVYSVSDGEPLYSPDWDEQAYSDYRGWPTTGAFHSQRLWLGGSPSLPAHIFGSRAAGFFNFDVGDAFPSDSIQFSIADDQVNKILSIVSGRHLQVFTDKAEYYAPETEDRPLAPEDFTIRKSSRYGSSKYQNPLVFDEATLFVQERGSNIREFFYSDLEAGYNAPSVSLAADSLLDRPYRGAVVAGAEDRPEQLALYVNRDGSIAWYQSVRREEIRGWGRWTTNDNGIVTTSPGFIDVCVVDEWVFALVRRRLYNSTSYIDCTCLEVFDWNRTLDCSTKWSDPGNPVSVVGQDVSGSLDAWRHFQGINLPLVTDSGSLLNAYHVGNYIVSGVGNVDISPLALDNATVGFNYTATATPMFPEVVSDEGFTLAEPKRIVQLAALVDNTLHIEVDGFPVYAKQVTQDFSIPPTPITGMRQWWQLGYSFRRTVPIVNDVPLPCTILALSMEVAF